MLTPPILILSDESTEYSKKIVGAVSISLNDFYILENFITKFRVDHKLFGEIKWEKVKTEGNYVDNYLQITQNALNLPSFRFHSNCYSGNQYKASYALVRSISWKLSNCGYKDSVGILFDEREKREVEITRDLLNKDRDFHHQVLFCTETGSKIFNTMQIADLLCGCLSYKINCGVKNITKINKCKNDFIKEIEKIDKGLELELTFGALWKYDSKKIQHFNLA